MNHLLVSFLFSKPSKAGLTLISLIGIGRGSMNPAHLNVIGAATRTGAVAPKELPMDVAAHVGLELEKDLFEE